jgi:coatomer protein complex subunit gamma
VFFAVTKLFQNKDVNLRRMVYLVVKDICPGADEVIIVTSSLMKDMNSKTDLFRSNSIRVLCKILDTSLLGQVSLLLSHQRYVCAALSLLIPLP